MKLFGRSGGYWLFWVSMVYLVIGLISITYAFPFLELLPPVYIVVLSLPLWVKPLAAWLNMLCIWEM